VTELETKRVMIFCSAEFEKTKQFRQIKNYLSRKYEIILPKCRNWMEKIDDGEMRAEEILNELSKYPKPNVILLLETDFVEIKGLIEEVYGWGVIIEDNFWETKRKICMALGLVGVDGQRSGKPWHGILE